MAETVRVKPRPGLILAGVPSVGIDLPRALAEEWIGNRLVVKVEPTTPPAERPRKPVKAGVQAGTSKRWRKTK